MKPALTILIFALQSCVQLAPADMLPASVVSVHDGDTLTVILKTNVPARVRLSAIDAPELAQPYGQESREALAHELDGAEVFLDTQGFDRYGRIVARVLHNGLDENLEQIRRGAAWLYPAYIDKLKTADRIFYLAASQEARTTCTGLWSLTSPEPPWVFRWKIHHPPLSP